MAKITQAKAAQWHTQLVEAERANRKLEIDIAFYKGEFDAADYAARTARQQLAEALDMLDNIVMAYKLPGDNSELENAIGYADRYLEE